MVSTTRPDLAEIVESDVLNAGISDEDRSSLARALAFAADLYGGRLLGTGEPAYEHAVGTARNVAELRLDADSRAAGLLFAVPAYLPAAEEVLTESFGAAVASLVMGISRLNALRVITRTAARGKDSQSQAEVLRKMLLAMVEDIRVVLLRLASRTQTLRWLARAPDAERAQVARETLDIYAPLANRLGVWQLKWELEDLAFRYLEPELYKRIAGLLEARRSERERFVEQAIAALADELARAGIRADISGRPKHLYSIYTKMRAKSLDFSQIHDVSGLRVLVDEAKDCYTVLGVVHNLWAPIPREFDDYISRPKANLYRSLHTAVIGPQGKALEVQIRTREMHRDAELGVAAHWRYKERAKRPTGKGDPFDEKIAWLRQMLAWRDEIVDASDWIEQSKHAVLDDTVYVLTPQGKVIDLPQGATPVDFAYALHSDIGHRCRGAKVNGAIVPLDYRLKNADAVEIITAKTGGPSRDWLNPALGYIKSSRARGFRRARGAFRSGRARGSRLAAAADRAARGYGALAFAGNSSAACSSRAIEQRGSRRGRRAPAHAARALLQARAARPDFGIRHQGARGLGAPPRLHQPRAPVRALSRAHHRCRLGQARCPGVPRGHRRPRERPARVVARRDRSPGAGEDQRDRGEDADAQRYRIHVLHRRSRRHRPVAARAVCDRGRARSSRCGAALTRPLKPGPEIAAFPGGTQTGEGT